MSEGSNNELLELSREVGREREGRLESGVGASVGRCSSSRLGMVFVDLSLGILEFGRFEPHSVPVEGSLLSRSSSDRLEDVLGRVVSRSTSKIGVSVKVIDHRERVFAELSKVDGLSTLHCASQRTSYWNENEEIGMRMKRRTFLRRRSRSNTWKSSLEG